MKAVPYHEQWAKNRQDTSSKVAKVNYLKEFEEALCELDFKLPPKHIDILDNTNVGYLQNTLIYSEGSPIFHHFNISPGGELLHKAGRGFASGVGCLNRFRNLWKWHDIDSNILDQYKDDKKWQIDLDSVTEEELTFVKKGEFDLFPLQFFDSCDMPETFDAIKCVFRTGKPTIFALHPVTHADIEKYGKIWDQFIEAQIVPDGAFLIHGRDTNSFIPYADKVYSANSAVSFSAMIAGKPTATYRATPWSEVLPVIDSAMHDVKDLKPVPEDDMKRFLSWYYNKFTIDLHSSDWKSKLEKIVEKKNNGKDFEGIFA